MAGFRFMSKKVAKRPKLEHSDEQAIYNVGSYSGTASYEKKLGPVPVTVEKFNYKWKVSCNRKVEDGEKCFVIAAEMTSGYLFDDNQILRVCLKNKDETISLKEFSFDKSKGKQDFEVKYDEAFPIPFDEIEVYGRMWVKDIKYYRSDWATEYNYQSKEKPHDVVLVVGNTKFYMFRNYLATWSKYFDRLFYGDFKEKNQDIIKLDDVDPLEFERILRFISPSHLSYELAGDQVPNVLKLADRLEIPNLMGRCGKILSDFGKTQNLDLLDRLELADKYNLVSLQVVCFERLHKMEEPARTEFFEKNRRRMQQLSNNVIRNLI